MILSIWNMDGEIIYDASTLEEEKRLPMVKPSGKYNVWNKTQYERGLVIRISSDKVLVIRLSIKATGLKNKGLLLL